MGRTVFASPSDPEESFRKKKTASEGFAHNIPHVISAETAVLAILAEAYITFFGLRGQAGKLTRSRE